MHIYFKSLRQAVSDIRNGIRIARARRTENAATLAYLKSLPVKDAVEIAAAMAVTDEEIYAWLEATS